MVNEPRSVTSATDVVKITECVNEEPETMISRPKPAETVPVPNSTNLPPVISTTAKQAADLGLSIVDAERDGQQLFLIVEGPNLEDVIGADSRKLAYDARFHYGFDNAGIEPYGGTEFVKESGKYRLTWKLTRSMI